MYNSNDNLYNFKVDPPKIFDFKPDPPITLNNNYLNGFDSRSSLDRDYGLMHIAPKYTAFTNPGIQPMGPGMGPMPGMGPGMGPMQPPLPGM